MTNKFFNTIVALVCFMTSAGAIGDFYGLIFIWNMSVNAFSKWFTLAILALGLIVNLFIFADILICYNDIKERMVI